MHLYAITAKWDCGTTFPLLNRRRNRGKTENTHPITDFSQLVFKVCINYGRTAQILYKFYQKEFYGVAVALPGEQHSTELLHLSIQTGAMPKDTHQKVCVFFGGTAQI